MKEDVKEMFAQITMPERTEESIRAAMAQHRTGKGITKTVWRGAVSFAATLALVFLLSPAARATVSGWIVKYVFPDSGLTIYQETDEAGNIISVVGVDTEATAFAEVRDGRLYFTCNGEEQDITDQITEEAPFYYHFVDEYGLTHYRVVGYSGTIENFGIYEFIRRVEEGQKDWEGWEGGSGRNFLNAETGIRYPWVDIVWEDLNIPWPKPE